MADKVALITGAGSGVGRAVAVALAADDYAVVLAGRRRDALDGTAALIGAGARVRVVPTDVADPAAVEALFAVIERDFGRLDVLFNNAGRGSKPVDVDELPVETWQRVVDVNLTGSFLCARAAFGLMKRQRPQGGRIINNGSISAHVPRPHSVPYTATKHAITGLTKALGLDGRKYDIVVGQIDIGNAATPMTERMASGVPQPNGTSMPEPTIEAGHVAKAVAYMASLPLDANVPFVTVMATRMPFLGRG